MKRNAWIIDDEETLKQKIDMLDVLSDMQLTIKMLRQQKEGGEDAVFKNYKSLKTEIVSVEDGEERKLIDTYLQNTHAPTHTNYTLELIDLFRVQREGEAERYKKFSQLHNRKVYYIRSVIPQILTLPYSYCGMFLD